MRRWRRPPLCLLHVCTLRAAYGPMPPTEWMNRAGNRVVIKQQRRNATVAAGTVVGHAQLFRENKPTENDIIFSSNHRFSPFYEIPNELKRARETKWKERAAQWWHRRNGKSPNNIITINGQTVEADWSSSNIFQLHTMFPMAQMQ